ncbi:DUF3574 domain-containing protein [Melittangium boletus]|uniref:DUF3574 domain-containing protein n=1 Tax=Melittangium boletus TaxID=83453 RepID=UPI003DA4E711
MNPSPLPFVLAVSLALSACGPEEAACAVGNELYRTELFFGLDRAHAAPITDAEFQDFVDTVVTPRFKAGLTVLEARGQYRMDTGELVYEPSKLIVLLHDGSTAISGEINAIREEYKQRFQQEAVLRIDSLSCVAFD